MLHNASLAGMNSFGFESVVDELVFVRSREELAEALETSTPITILGEGTNVVLKPRIHGRVIRLALRSINEPRASTDGVRVTADAGVNWHELVRYCLGRGIGGLENLALIPGSVGAAPFQNIGAYGVELREICEGVHVFDREQGVACTLSNNECEFTYRDSAFKSQSRNRFVICGLTLHLSKQNLRVHYRDVHQAVSTNPKLTLTPSAVAEIVIQIRRRKLPDPRAIGNAGSFFKNPVLRSDDFDRLRAKLAVDGHRESEGVKVPAARLIDAAGWKGVRCGDAQVWPRQPLVLVNLGNATAGEVLDLAARIADDVHRRYDVQLELEPEVIGTD